MFCVCVEGKLWNITSERDVKAIKHNLDFVSGWNLCVVNVSVENLMTIPRRSKGHRMHFYSIRSIRRNFLCLLLFDLKLKAISCLHRNNVTLRGRQETITVSAGRSGVTLSLRQAFATTSGHFQVTFNLIKNLLGTNYYFNPYWLLTLVYPTVLPVSGLWLAVRKAAIVSIVTAQITGIVSIVC